MAKKDQAVPKYLRQTTTGLCFAYSAFKAHREDMVPWTGPLPWEKEKEVAKDPAAETAEDVQGDGKNSKDVNADPETADEGPEKEPGKSREELVREAVAKIDPEDFVQARFGRPAMPRVSDIEELTGLTDVTADEIISALPPQE